LIGRLVACFQTKGTGSCSGASESAGNPSCAASTCGSYVLRASAVFIVQCSCAISITLTVYVERLHGSFCCQFDGTDTPHPLPAPLSP
jgi:hypothetical protein